MVLARLTDDHAVGGDRAFQAFVFSDLLAQRQPRHIALDHRTTRTSEYPEGPDSGGIRRTRGSLVEYRLPRVVRLGGESRSAVLCCDVAPYCMALIPVQPAPLRLLGRFRCTSNWIESTERYVLRVLDVLIWSADRGSMDTAAR